MIFCFSRHAGRMDHYSTRRAPTRTGDTFIVKYRARHANGTAAPIQYRFRNADGRLLRFDDHERLLRFIARLWCEVSQ